jgi:hypothetical protein
MCRHLYISIAVGLLAGTISGIASEQIVHKVLEPKAPEIAVVDLKSIITEHQEMIMKKYPADKFTDETKKAIQANAETFARSLTMAISELNKGHILMVKDAVIGHTPDFTDEVRSMLNGPEKR